MSAAEDYIQSFLQPGENVLWISKPRKTFPKSLEKRLDKIILQVFIATLIASCIFISDHTLKLRGVEFSLVGIIAYTLIINKINRLVFFIFALTNQRGIIVSYYPKGVKKNGKKYESFITSLTYEQMQEFTEDKFGDFVHVSFISSDTKSLKKQVTAKYFIVSNDQLNEVKNIITTKGQISS